MNVCVCVCVCNRAGVDCAVAVVDDVSYEEKAATWNKGSYANYSNMCTCLCLCWWVVGCLCCVRLCVCLCCMSACMYVCMYVCMCACACAFTCVCVRDQTLRLLLIEVMVLVMRADIR